MINGCSIFLQFLWDSHLEKSRRLPDELRILWDLITIPLGFFVLPKLLWCAVCQVIRWLRALMVATHIFFFWNFAARKLGVSWANLTNAHIFQMGWKQPPTSFVFLVYESTKLHWRLKKITFFLLAEKWIPAWTGSRLRDKIFFQSGKSPKSTYRHCQAGQCFVWFWKTSVPRTQKPCWWIYLSFIL